MMADEFNHISSIRAGERPIHAEFRVTSSRLAIAVTVVGLVFSFVAAGVVGRWENSTSKVEFDGVAKNQTIILQSGINEYLARLLALRTLFETFNAQITRSEFDVFNTRLFEEHPGILRVNWVPRVMREERVGFEKAAVFDGVAGYQIKAVASDGALVSAPERDEYFPILYSTVPTTSVIYGSDLASQMQKHDTINVRATTTRLQYCRMPHGGTITQRKASSSPCRFISRVCPIARWQTGAVTLPVSLSAGSISRIYW